mgnify:CR=1 FL=1
MTSLAHAALDQLSALLGKRCLTDPDSAQRYGVDWTKVWAPAPSAVVLPETTEEVQQIVEIAFYKPPGGPDLGRLARFERTEAQR